MASPQVRLLSAINRLNRNFETGLRREFSTLSFELKNTYSVLANIRKSFGGAEGIQKKALAINSNLLKTLTTNADNLKKLRGSFFDNAEDLLKNFSEGIRDNSDGLNSLMVRMRLTGQSTDLLRGVSKSLLEMTGGNIDVVDRLMKSNVRIARDNVVSNESLIDAVKSLKDSMDIPSLYGYTEDMADLTQELSGRLKGLGAEDLQKTLGLLFDSSMESMTTKMILGIDDTFQLFEKSLTTSQRADEVVKLLSNANKTLNNNFKIQKGQFAVNMTNSMLNSIGNAQQLTALSRVSNLLERQDSTTESMRAAQDEYYMTSENLTKESLNFYEQTTGTFYPKMISILEKIGPSLAGLGAATAGVGLARMGTKMAGIGSIMRVLGPVGLIAGVALPAIMNFMDSEKKNKEIFRAGLDEEKKTREAVQSIDKKTLDQNKKEDTNSSAWYFQTASRALMELATSVKNNTRKDELEELRRTNKNLQDMIKVMKSNNAKGF